MRALLLVIASIFVLCSCASPRPWTREEKVAAGFCALGHIADAYTTDRMLDKGYTEGNPILGEHPSDSDLMIYFPVTFGINLAVSHFFPKLRKPLLYGYGGLSFGAAMHNQRLN